MTRFTHGKCALRGLPISVMRMIDLGNKNDQSRRSGLLITGIIVINKIEFLDLPITELEPGLFGSS